MPRRSTGKVDIATSRIEQAIRVGARGLDLSQLGLTELPRALYQITPRLHRLDLSYNSLTCLPDDLYYLKHLRSLIIQHNRLQSISISSLKALERLDVSYNTTLGQLPVSIGGLTHITRIDAAGCKLSAIPESLGELTRLEELNLTNNQLTTLSFSGAGLTRLRRLDITYNKFSQLPDCVSSLSGLVGLHISSNPLTALPSWIGDIISLQYLSAANTSISEFPKSLCRLSNLKLLSLSCTPLRTIPAAIGALTSLEGLNLSMAENLFVWEPDRWALMPSGYGEGQLRSLPKTLRSLRFLRELYLHGQPALSLPPEVLGPSWGERHSGDKPPPANPAAIIDYYLQTHGKDLGRPLNEAKMILVGRGGVGKTSLVNRLVNQAFNEKEIKTDGIFITPWKFRIREDQITLNIWDFGGQEIMHSTHQFFLTKRSLYLLVINAREGEQDANVEYWLRLIESFGGDSPIIVAINKIADHHFDLNRRGLREKFPAICMIVQTDCSKDIGLKELREAILQETDRLEHLRDLFPRSWFAVKEKLGDLRRHESQDFISFSRYQEICLLSGIEERIGQDTLVGFLHDLGIVVNFRDDPRLSEMHVLNPEWVTNGIYKILNASTVAERRGELSLSDLSGVLDAKLYPRNMHLFLLDLMRKFELCYEYYDNVGHYLVPELLGKEEPDLAAYHSQEALRFEYSYNIIPEGLLPRFIVRSRALNKDQPRWRTGVVLRWEQNVAVVKADTQDRRISISIRGPAPGRRRLLAVIRADFEHIHRSIAKLQATEGVPVPGHPGLVADYQTLLVLESERESQLTLVHSGRVVKLNISDLLGGVEEARRNASLGQVPAAMRAVRVAFSYSHKDEELRDQLETHLKLLQRQHFVSSWHDRKIGAGDTWRDAIDDNFRAADLILLLVSPDFIASDYCYETEIKLALERKEARIVPVILRACDWKTAPFGDLQALPKDGKPITSWTNRDEAWNDVAQGIRRTVERFRSES